MSAENQQTAEPSEEDIKQYREKLLSYYDEETVLLKKQADYQELRANLAEAKLREEVAIMRMAALKAGPEKESKKSKEKNHD